MKYAINILTINPSTNISILKHSIYNIDWLPTQASVQRHSLMLCARTYFARSICVLQPNAHNFSKLLSYKQFHKDLRFIRSLDY